MVGDGASSFQNWLRFLVDHRCNRQIRHNLTRPLCKGFRSLAPLQEESRSVNLANTYQSAGRTTEAIGLLEQVRDALKEKLGADPRKTLATLVNLASSYERAGRTTEAIPLLEHTLERRGSVLGEQHPKTRLARQLLTTTYQALGKHAEAE